MITSEHTARLEWTNRGLWQRSLFDDDNQMRIKAGERAARAEGARLMQLMRAEIRAGAPGGKLFQELTEISLRWRGMGVRRKRKPMSRLAIPVRYWADTAPGGGFMVSVGYQAKPVVSSKGYVNVRNQLSRSWVYLATKLQGGHAFGAGELQASSDVHYFAANARTRLFREGVAISARGRISAARWFFLKKSTKMLKIPERPIIEPFWHSRITESAVRVQQNFGRLLSGEKVSWVDLKGDG